MIIAQLILLLFTIFSLNKVIAYYNITFLMDFCNSYVNLISLILISISALIVDRSDSKNFRILYILNNLALLIVAIIYREEKLFPYIAILFSLGYFKTIVGKKSKLFSLISLVMILIFLLALGTVFKPLSLAFILSVIIGFGYSYLFIKKGKEFQKPKPKKR